MKHVPKGLVGEENFVVLGAEGLVDFAEVAIFELLGVENTKNVIDFDDGDETIFIWVNLTTIAHEVRKFVLVEEHGHHFGLSERL